MAEQKGGGWSVPWPAVIALVVAGGGEFFLLPQLTSSRPGAEGGRRVETIAEEDVDARLWQDPFRAAREHRDAVDRKYPKAAGKPSAVSFLGLPLFTVDPSPPPAADGASPADRRREEEAHDLKTLARQIAERSQSDRLLVLPVMVENGPSAEQSEQRLRVRHAVLDALAVGHFVPEDSEHVGYFDLPWKPAKRTVVVAAGGESAGEPVVATPVPFEWCKPTADHVSEDQGGEPFSRVLIVWLPEEAFGDER